MAIGAVGVAPVAGHEDADMNLVFLGLDNVGEEFPDAPENEVLLGLGEVGKGHVEPDLAFSGAFELFVVPLVDGLGPGVDGAFLEGQAAIGDQLVDVVIHGASEALAGGAGAEGIIEAEEAGLGVAELDAADFAGEFFVEEELARGIDAGLLEQDLAAFAVGDLDCIDEALVQVFADYQTIDEDVNRFGEIEIEEALGCGELVGLACLKEAVEAAGAQFKEAVAQGVGLQARRGNGEEGVPAGAWLFAQHLGSDLIDGVA